MVNNHLEIFKEAKKEFCISAHNTSLLVHVCLSHDSQFVFQDAVADHIFEQLLEFFSVHAHSIAFPEVALPAVVRVSACLIARSDVPMETGDKFLNFHSIRKLESIAGQITLKLASLPSLRPRR